jgi:hypothetical protein
MIKGLRLANWYWLCADDGTYDSREELRHCRARSRYDAALLVNMLTDAMEFGSAEVEEDKVIGSPFWFYQSGGEGVFYLVENRAAGADVTIAWVGSVRQIGYGEAFTEARRRLANLK